MSWHSKVVWTQGMFLQPHHFQQEARHVERLLSQRLHGISPFAWGFSELVIDEAGLALGRLGLQRAAGVMPDGTPFTLPSVEPAPAPFEVPADMKGEAVVLALPREREGVTEVDFGDAGPQALCRWRVADESVRDHTHAADEPEPLQTALPALRLMRERDASDAFAVLAVARVAERRADGQLVLERTHLAPQLRLDATGQLSASAGLLHGLVQQRARTLAARMGQGGQGVSEMADFLMLMALNRAEPLLRQMAGSPHAHPLALHALLLGLAGELASFESERRHPPDYPLYRHEDLHASFTPVIEDLRRMLSTVLERNAVQVPLTARSHGVHTAVVGDAELLRSAAFVLAVQAQVPAEQLRQRFPLQSKLGPVDRLRDLVNLQLPGVGLRVLPVAPRQLPYHAGHHYFELERGGELWQQLERSGSLALHVAGDFPGLELQLWAIRS